MTPVPKPNEEPQRFGRLIGSTPDELQQAVLRGTGSDWRSLQQSAYMMAAAPIGGETYTAMNLGLTK